MIDYGAINQVFPDVYLLNNIPAPSDLTGALQPTNVTPLLQISDGLSNTIMIGEDAGAPSNYVFGKMIPQGVATGINGVATPTADWGWADGGFAYSINGADPVTGAIIKQSATTGNPSCMINCNNNGELYSFHSGGVNVVFADGSVHFLSQSITVTTVAALVTKNGGEVLPVAID
jgi:prepilin-type processing-associated H-X9-DG protein